MYYPTPDNSQINPPHVTAREMLDHLNLTYKDTFTTGERVILTSYLSLTLLVGLPGNMFVVYVCTKHSTLRLDPVSELFVMQISLSAIMKALTTNVAMLTTHFAQGWVFGDLACEITAFCMSMAATANIIFIMSITCHRFVICTLYPRFRGIRPPLAKTLCLVEWVVSVVAGVLYILANHQLEFEAAAALCIHTHDRLFVELSVVICVVVMVVMIICLNIASLVCSAIRKGTNTSTGNKTVLGLSVCLIVSYVWVPYFMEMVLSDNNLIEMPGGQFVQKLVTHLSVFSVIGNPIVYTLANPKFKLKMKREVRKITQKTSRICNNNS